MRCISTTRTHHRAEGCNRLRTRVKICGVKQVDDALAAAAAGADAVGLVFYASSPRHVDLRVAQEICHALPPFVTTVGLFVDPSHDEVATVAEQVDLDLLQFHGSESLDFCDNCRLPYIKAVRMREGVDIAAAAQRYPSAKALLVDSFDASLAGGSGRGFAWDRIPATRTKPIVLAGGLTAANVGHGIATVHPYAVDVSTGVERTRGQKDAAKIRSFIEAVMRADHRDEAAATDLADLKTFTSSL